MTHYIATAATAFVTGVFLVLGMTVAGVLVRTIAQTKAWQQIKDYLNLK